MAALLFSRAHHQQALHHTKGRNPNDALFNESRINIENFYGIEIDDFAIEVATLSVWIAKHQMNRELQEQFGISIPRKWAQGFHQDAMACVADPTALQPTGETDPS